MGAATATTTDSRTAVQKLPGAAATGAGMPTNPMTTPTATVTTAPPSSPSSVLLGLALDSGVRPAALPIAMALTSWATVRTMAAVRSPVPWVGICSIRAA